MIRVSGEEWGCITTTDEYENYTLTVEFKWGATTWDARAEKLERFIRTGLATLPS